jgi:2-methylisocitrate lyase-like PEP mutase family enzyme
MTRTTIEKRAAFRALHSQGCFVLPNPWDVGSARMFEHLGFEALASTSTGYAWTTGRPDYAMTRDDVLGHLTALCAGTELPVNADFESGFADDLEGLSKSVSLAVETGVAGLSIEDRDMKNLSRLYDVGIAVERIRTARAAIDESGQDVILVARTEGLLIDQTALSKAIDKLVAFAEAGADCLYAPGVSAKEDIRAMVRAVAPKPINVLVISDQMQIDMLAELGVRRVSVGGGLAVAAWDAALTAAEKLKGGSISGLTGCHRGPQLNQVFSKFV